MNFNLYFIQLAKLAGLEVIFLVHLQSFASKMFFH